MVSEDVVDETLEVIQRSFYDDPGLVREMNEYWADYKAGRLQKFGKAATLGA